MKNFFKNKLNVVLTIILIVLIGIGTFLGYKFFASKTIKAIDFSNMFEDEVVNWSIENEIQDKFEYEHNFDEKIESGKVIYQSIKEGEDITEKILIIISDGPDQKDFIDIPVDTLKSQTSCEEWFKEFGFINVKYEFDDKSSLDEGSIISIEPTKAKKEDSVLVKVASKNNIDVPDFAYMSDDEITKWSNENKVKVDYVYQESSQKKGSFLKQSIASGKKCATGSKITITISSGETKSPTIPATYLGIEESKFLENLKNLGFEKVKKDDETYFSVSSKKGTIFSYDDGTFPVTQTIKYAISAGKYELNKDEFQDISLSKAKELVKAYDDRNAHLTLETTETKTSDHHDGYVYDCSSTFSSPNTKISCKLAKNDSDYSGSEAKEGDVVYIDPYDYLGASEEKFLSDLKFSGFKNITKADAIYSNKYKKGTVCYYLPDGNQKNTTPITYKLSLGTYASNFDANEYNGKTLDQANAVIKTHKDKGANISLSTTNVETNDHDEGTLYSCSFSGSTVACKLAKKVSQKEEPKEEPKQDPLPQEKTATILSFDTLENYYSTASYDTTLAKITSYFENNGFTNVTYKGSKSTNSAGTLVSVSVNGNSDYSEGKYSLNTPIVVTISTGN